MSIDMKKMKMNGALHVLTDKLDEFKDLLHDAQVKGKRTFNQFKRTGEDVICEGQEKLKDTAVSLQKTVKKNPWAYIGAAAAAAFVTGLLVGIIKKRE